MSEIEKERNLSGDRERKMRRDCDRESVIGFQVKTGPIP